MYSEVLAQIDRNTERYMVDEMKQEVEELKHEAEELKQEAEELKQEAEELKQETEELKQEAEELKQELASAKADMARSLFANGASYDLVRNSISGISDKALTELYSNSHK